MMSKKRPGSTSTYIPVQHAYKSLMMITMLASLLLISMNATQMRYQAEDMMHMSLSHYDVGNRATLLQGNVVQQSPRVLRSDDGTVMLLDSERTLWTAGWNARYTRYYKGSIPAISWTIDADTIFETEYRRLHFPSTCADVKGWLVTKPYWWGLVSVARDYQSDILRAMSRNLTLVHDGDYVFCPEHPERYLNCFWEDFNACQDTWKSHLNVPVFDRMWQDSVQPVTSDDFPEWLWEKMARDGHIQIRDTLTGVRLSSEESSKLDPDMFLQLKLSVIRAIMTKVVFKPRSYIAEKAERVIDMWRRNGTYEAGTGNGLIVHIRRTDKKDDLGPHWRHIDFNSTGHMGAYVQTMEAATNAAFSRFLVLSDDPHMHSQAVDELTPYFRNKSGIQSLYSNNLCHFLGSNTFNYTGHESLDHQARHDLYVLLLSDVYAAVQVSDYIIGSGSCGVSQFLAWNLGGKHRFEPSLAAFWEEDIIVKECRWLSKLIENEDLQSQHQIRLTMLNREWTERDCGLFLPS